MTPKYAQFTQDETLNFMLNRLSWDINHELLRGIGKRVSTLPNFVEVMLGEAEKAEADGRLREAGFLYRGAEFYIKSDHPKKTFVYDKFMEYFYSETPGVKEQSAQIDYKSGKLGVIDVPAKGEEKDIILMCSGFDGLIEELYPVATTMSEAGYRVVLYEGPGQGAALRRYNLPMTHDWEHATSRVLDQLNIESCILIGMSLGGYFAPRAAAYEKRIKRVVCWGAMYSLSDCVKKSLGAKGDVIFKLVDLGLRKLVNKMTYAAAKKDPGTEWGVAHGLHTSGTKDPYDFNKWQRQFTTKDFSHLIEQDALIVMGEKDHLVPFDQLRLQMEALTNAKSVTTRKVTAYEQGAEHCQIGNPDLVVNQILSWLSLLDDRDISLSAGD